MKTLRFITMDGDTLVCEINGSYMDMKLFDVDRQSPDDFTPIRLSTGATLDLLDALRAQLT